MNERLRIAMALFQAMNLYGLEYSIDPDSSYIELPKSDSALRIAFITVPGHNFLAFALDLDEAEARRTFSRPEEFILLDKETWVPVEAPLIKRNFLDAWAPCTPAMASTMRRKRNSRRRPAFPTTCRLWIIWAT